MKDLWERLLELITEDVELHDALVGYILAKKDHEMALAERARR